MPRSLAIPPENIRKPKVFCFQGVEKEISGMKWVNFTNLSLIKSCPI